MLQRGRMDRRKGAQCTSIATLVEKKRVARVGTCRDAEYRTARGHVARGTYSCLPRQMIQRQQQQWAAATVTRTVRHTCGGGRTLQPCAPLCARARSWPAPLGCTLVQEDPQRRPVCTTRGYIEGCIRCPQVHTSHHEGCAQHADALRQGAARTRQRYKQARPQQTP